MEPISYRLINSADAAEVKKLWQYCFKDTNEFVQLYFDNCFKAANTIGAYQKDKLLAAAQLNEYTINLRDADVQIDYIVGVETAPEARGGGIAGELMKELLNESVRRGHYLTILMPFSAGFYHKFGWRFCYCHKRYEVQLNQLKPLCRDYGQLNRIDPLGNIAILDEIYREYCGNYHGYTKRTAENWRIMLTDLLQEGGHCAVLFDNDGQAQGYVLYTFDHEKISVLEMAYTDYRAKAGLMQYLYRHRSQVENITMPLAQDDEDFYLFDDKQGAKIIPFMMARIADVQKLLESLSCEDNIFLKIKVNDFLMSNNNNVFAISSQAGKMKVEPTLEEWDMQLDIGELTQLVLGATDSQSLYNLGKLTLNNKSALDICQKLWPKKVNFINEYF